MRIDVKGRNVAVGDELRERIEKRFQKIGRQVSDLAQLDVELKEEKNPSIRDSCVAEGTLYLKGVIQLDYGLSTAMGVVLLVLAFAVTYFSLRYSRGALVE